MNARSNRNYSFDRYSKRFLEFLKQKNLRNTYERESILLSIYELEPHFTIDSLKQYLRQNKYHISKSTLYNTLILFVEAGLIAKHHFPTQTTPLYEKLYAEKTDNHIYIEETQTIIEFSDKRIEKIIKNIEKKYKISPTRHSFIIYCDNKQEKDR
jgi:Fur family ferric uptake transcriptional regulator